MNDTGEIGDTTTAVTPAICCLHIAGFRIRIVNPDENSRLETGYLHYIVPKSDLYDLELTVIPVQKLKLPPGIPAFEASSPGKKYFSIYNADNDRILLAVYNPNPPYQLQQVAEICLHDPHWTIHTQLFQSGLYSALAYPLGPLIFYHLCLLHPAIMIHASGVGFQGKGRLFTGFSGTGKSTMAELWIKNQAFPVNDDRILIRSNNGRFEMHNTPMFYAQHPASYPLDAVYLIRHNAFNRIVPLKGAEAVSGMLAFCIQHHYSRRNIESHLEFISGLVEKVPVFSCGFVPDNSIVRYIVENGV